MKTRKRIRTQMKIKRIRGGLPDREGREKIKKTEKKRKRLTSEKKGILLRSKEEKDISLKNLLKKMTPDELKELAKNVDVPEETVKRLLKDLLMKNKFF